MDFEFDLLSGEELSKVDQYIGMKGKEGQTPITDLAIINGSLSTPVDGENFGCFWTKDRLTDITVGVSDTPGFNGFCYDDRRYPAIKPVIRNEALFDKLVQTGISTENGTDFVEFGEYPQFAVSQALHEKLDELHKSKSLQLTGAVYTFDSLVEDHINGEKFDGFMPVTYNEYEFEGKKYVRIPRLYNFFNRSLSNGMSKFDRDYFWLEVTPVKWMVLKEQKMLIAENGLVSGLNFGIGRSFEESFIKKYLDSYFIHDLLQHSDEELLIEQKTEIEKGECRDLKSKIAMLFKKKKAVENKVCPEGPTIAPRRLR